MTVRPATPADAAALAEVHVRGWQAAYRGLVPQSYLDGLDPAARLPGWQQWLRELQPPGAILVLDAGDGRVGGFATVGASRDPDTDPRLVGEIMAIYVDPARWRRRGGSQLMAAALERLAAFGFGQAVLWVLESNARARHFYAATGWHPDGMSKVDEERGFPLTEVRYRRRIAGDGDRTTAIPPPTLGG